MTYDDKVIVQFATSLYRKADLVMVVYTLTGFIGGFALGVALEKHVHPFLPGVVLGILAIAIAHDRAMRYRLQAQTALCQVQIERNTRQLLRRAENEQPLPAEVADVERAEPELSREPVLMGTCPNCDAEIPLESKFCPRCRALFGERSAWKVRPIDAPRSDPSVV